MEKTPEEIANDILCEYRSIEGLDRENLANDIAAAIREAEERERSRLAQLMRKKAVQYGEDLRSGRVIEAWQALSRFADDIDP